MDIEDAAHLIAIRRQGNSLRLNHAPEGFFYAVTAMDRYGNESEPLQMAASPSFTMPGSFLECDGKQLSLPPRDKALDADMLFVETCRDVPWPSSLIEERRRMSQTSPMAFINSGL